MGLKALEEERLKEWFFKKYSGKCCEIAVVELNEKKKNQRFLKRIFNSKEETDWLIHRVYELLKKKWEEALKNGKEVKK